MIYAPNILMIGSAGRNSGKTVLACELIARFSGERPVFAAKVAAISGGPCPRGSESCGACSTLEGPFSIAEETAPGTQKDTQRMVAAGAQRVFWLRARKECLEEGVRALLDLIPADTLCVLESNSARTVLEPQLFFMCREMGSTRAKGSARAVEEHADALLENDGTTFHPSPAAIDVVGGRWTWRYPAAAIVLAGGNSTRMGCDKSLLPLNGAPLIQHLCRQLEPHFEEIIISTNRAEKYAFLEDVDHSAGVSPATFMPPGRQRYVGDLEPGTGPLCGIISALADSHHERNFVVACDTPKVDVRLLRQLMRAQAGHDAAIPVTDGRRQPLAAVYARSALAKLEKAYAVGVRSVNEAVDTCTIAPISAEDTAIKNINTMEDYRALVEGNET
jgi:molybdopterin-guanine dinucleotide biosynthesis protein A